LAAVSGTSGYGGGFRSSESFAQVGGHLVPVYTVETALRHDATSVQQFVFIRR
jgi:hypothetical protein